jgi:large subunit ribosomal protein L24
MATKMKIKKKDRVIVIAGKDKGKIGEVTMVMPKENRVVVAGVNVVSRHTRATPQDQGGIKQKEASIHVSNVAHLDPKDNKPVRVGFKTVKDTKVRFAKRSGQAID